MTERVQYFFDGNPRRPMIMPNGRVVGLFDVIHPAFDFDEDLCRWPVPFADDDLDRVNSDE